ncbi:MAG: RNA polymerase sigma factor [Planctomycetota bacterium]
MVDETRLVSLARGGDRGAAGELVRLHERAVYAVALARLRNETDAREVAQEALVKALLRLDKLRDDTKFGAWSVRIAIRLAADRKRRAKRLASLTGENVDPGKGPMERLLDHERRERLLAELGRLPEDVRQIFLLHYVDGARYARIAELLGVPEGTIAWKLHRARRSLRTSLSDLVEEDR